MYDDTFDIPYAQSADDDDALHMFYRYILDVMQTHKVAQIES